VTRKRMARRELSQEERQRRSDLARRLHAEGRFGGPQPGSGRPRKARAAQIVAEAAKETENAKLMIASLKDALQPGQPPTVRVQAAKTWLEIEQKEDALQLKEEVVFEGLQREQLQKELAERLLRLQDAGALPVIEAEVVREEQRELPAA
jgi:hypothetical protein